jgi:hypothetical protein
MKQATIRKFVSLVLALTLVMGMSVTVFADDYEDDYYYENGDYDYENGDYDYENGDDYYVEEPANVVDTTPVAPVLTGLFPPANIQPGEFCYVSGNWYHGIPTPWAMQ